MKKVLISLFIASLIYAIGFILYPNVINVLHKENGLNSSLDIDIFDKVIDIKKDFENSFNKNKNKNNKLSKTTNQKTNAINYITITNDISTITILKENDILTDIDKAKLYEDIMNDMLDIERGSNDNNLASITIVIDDSGNTLKHYEEYIKLASEYNITFAIMPDAPKAREFDQLCFESGVNTIIHVPMENKGAKYFGEKTIIKTYMNNDEISNILDYSFSIVPHATGINNHTGSYATADKRTMNYVLNFLKYRDKYFFDSLTSGDSIAYSLAIEKNIATAKRDVFLDNNDDYDSVLKQWNLLLKIAKKEGRAIAIGHYWSDNTFNVLANELPNIQTKNIVAKNIKDVLH